LFYFNLPECFVFGSELGALKQHPAMPREYNLQALHDYFSLQYVPAPFTVYRKVFKLPPAHHMEIDLKSGQLALKNYWRPDFSRKTLMSFREASDRLRELLTAAVKKRLMSDVPYGAFLSGGLDSSIIVGIMAQLCDHPVKTFTIGFNERLYDERDYALMASHAINKHAKFPVMYNEKIVDPENFSVLQELVKHYGEPYSDASMLPTFLLSKFTGEHVKVVLSGDGADELFAGYERYLVMKYAAVVDVLPLWLRRRAVCVLSSILPAKTEERGFSGRLQRVLAVLAEDRDGRYLSIINRFPHSLKMSIYGERFKDELPDTLITLNAIRDCGTAKNRIEQLIETDIYSYLPGDILTKVDIASMACSLELRSPFMDHELVEFSASLPLDYKQRGRSRKHILKNAFAYLLPEELRERSKKGFGVPIAAWFRNDWKNILTEKLLDGLAVEKGFLRREKLEDMIQAHVNNKADYSYALWAMLIFELFLEQE
jgi:asparagine synthase (glutamine-hydrolysing)